jgi:hypothetical protein
MQKVFEASILLTLTDSLLTQSDFNAHSALVYKKEDLLWTPTLIRELSTENRPVYTP